jgi:hypothetical protein
MLVNIKTQPMIAPYAVAGAGASLMTRSKHAAEWLCHGDAPRRTTRYSKRIPATHPSAGWREAGYCAGGSSVNRSALASSA